MLKAKLHAGAWVVVCDGGRALILQNAGDAKFPNLKALDGFRHLNAPTHEQGTDAPGRAFASAGGARSAVSQTDWHEQAEQQFLRSLAHHINEAVASGVAKSLILIAPPRALGVLREALSPAARETVHAELDRDYVKLPTYEIEQRVLEHLRN